MHANHEKTYPSSRQAAYFAADTWAFSFGTRHRQIFLRVWVMTQRAFSCFVDDAPIYRVQTFIWLNCLKLQQGIGPSSIFVHTTDSGSPFRDWLSSERVNIVELGAFDPRNRHCNKLQQLATFARGAHDPVVFMDCDTAWVGKGAMPDGHAVSARIVDFADPPESILVEIFAASGLGRPDWRPVSFPRGADRELTDVNNCNGGLYICAGEFLKELAPRWRFWARWCLDHGQLFQSFFMHADQVSFALAMRELHAKVFPLPLVWNYPTHVASAELPNIDPQILHYHREMTNDARLKAIGVPLVDDAIQELNKNLARVGKTTIAAICQPQ